MDLHDSTLSGFYTLCRSVLLHSEADFDRFDQVFLEFFKDVKHVDEVPPEMLKWLEHPELEISVDILYRKYAAYKQDDYDGILGIRGGWNKGRSSIPPELWNVYLYYWLDDNQPTAAQSYLNTVEWCRDFRPELLDSIPSDRAFRYRVARDVDDYIKCMAREGQKACHDRYAPYIVRWYDDLNANDCWIADNHTIDVQSIDDKDKQHRLYLTGFLDAKSGVLVGYNITDTPSSQSTICLLYTSPSPRD